MLIGFHPFLSFFNLYLEKILFENTIKIKAQVMTLLAIHSKINKNCSNILVFNKVRFDLIIIIYFLVYNS